jgi:long-chain acyl-CoA synthetase
MLYDRWHEIATARRSEIALRDATTGEQWTFAQLLAQSDAASDPGEAWVFPRGSDAKFIFELLCAWRHNRVACPLEINDPIPAAPLPPKEIVHIKRTSATTGVARLVALTAKQLAADPANIISTMGLRPEWPNVAAISLAHSYGFSNLVLPLLLHGIPLVLLNSALPEAMRQVLGKFPAVTLAAVPTLWRAWHGAGVITPNVRLAISAGAPLPLLLESDVFAKYGVKIHNFLGASECGGIAYDRSDIPRKDPSAAGAPLDNVSLSSVDGMLEVRGASVAQTYWPEPQPALGGGVFRSNDLVEIKDGLLLMRGRASDVIHISGRKVAPEEIERALLQHPDVSECMAFDAPRAGEENQIVVVVVGEKNREALRHFLSSKLPPWQIPRQWFFVESLGANERGKVSRAHWRQRFLSGQIK